MTDHDKKTLLLKIAAQDVYERALIAYYTEEQFHRDSLANSVGRLKEAIAQYEKESE